MKFFISLQPLLITYKEREYPFYVPHKNLRKRKLISNISVSENENYICILPNSDKLELYPICYNNDELVWYNLEDNDIPYTLKTFNKVNDEYNKITIHTQSDDAYLLYNYRGFTYINKDTKLSLSLFNKDIYTMPLYYQYNNYLLIPNYNEEHYFSKFYLIDMKNGKVKEIISEDKISYDTIMLGSYKNKIYFLDKKEKQEYYLNIKKEVIKKIDYQILENNKLVTKTYNDIVNNNLDFLTKNYIDYKIIDNKLYISYLDKDILISEKNISKIVKNDNDVVYYLVGDALYRFDFYHGEVLLLSNFEWNFNSNNMIFITR